MLRLFQIVAAFRATFGRAIALVLHAFVDVPEVLASDEIDPPSGSAATGKDVAVFPFDIFVGMVPVNPI